jgi:hypothetical protein
MWSCCLGRMLNPHQSENRINVALSRAKHGLYIMGNASNLRRNPTWCTILDEMEREGQIGFGFPIICLRHPDQVKLISEPGQLNKVAPLGTSKEYTANVLLTPPQVAAHFHAGSNSLVDISAHRW